MYLSILANASLPSKHLLPAHSDPFQQDDIRTLPHRFCCIFNGNPHICRITAGRSFRPSPRNPTVCPFVCSVSTSMLSVLARVLQKYLFSQPLWAIHFQKEHPAVLLSDNSLREFRYACKWIVLLVFDLLSAPLHSHEDCEASELHLRHSSLAHQKMPDTPTE